MPRTRRLLPWIIGAAAFGFVVVVFGMTAFGRPRCLCIGPLHPIVRPRPFFGMHYAGPYLFGRPYRWPAVWTMLFGVVGAVGILVRYYIPRRRRSPRVVKVRNVLRKRCWVVAVGGGAAGFAFVFSLSTANAEPWPVRFYYSTIFGAVVFCLPFVPTAVYNFAADLVGMGSRARTVAGAFGEPTADPSEAESGDALS